MKRLLFLIVSCHLIWLIPVFNAVAQTHVIRDTIPYVSGDCDATGDLSSQNVSLRLRGDTIYIEGWLAANHCGEHYLAYEQWEDTVSVWVYDKFADDEPCETNCLYPVNAKIGNCRGEYYKVNIRNDIAGNFDKDAVLKRNYRQVLTGDTVKWSYLGYFASDAPLSSVDFLAYGDTVINGLAYRHFANCYDVLEEFWRKWNKTEATVDNVNELWLLNDYVSVYRLWEIGYIRESQDGAQLFILLKDDMQEYLLYDLNANEGDMYLVDNDYMTVTSVGLENGLKQIILESNRYPDIIVREGLVPLNWFFDWGSISDKIFLNCFKNSDVSMVDISFEREYAHLLPAFRIPCGCSEPLTDLIDDISNEDFYAEIRDGELEIFLGDKFNACLDLYHIGGLQVYKSAACPSYVEISTDGLQSGLYILRVTARDGRLIGVRKIIIP